ncbi:LCP family glycopolymer transferase [Ligilactobacillus cholophilus]|uniref:LCP family glycopolymer transferase n=1 Tax=Ligilactobacillus cholophilus TaxID=3050131 RepID=UPI003EB86F87
MTEHGDLHHHHHRHRHHHKGKKMGWGKKIAIVIGVFLLIDALAIAKMYYDAKNSIGNTYQSVKNEQTTKLDGKHPFSILILGSDTGEFGRTYRGRSDTIMVAAVNNKKTTLVSIPRDTKVSIAGHGDNNKINAAYSYDGVSGAINTVEDYLKIPINYYIEINMKGLKELSSAIGPVKVDNDLDFTSDGIHFEKGEITIDSNNILAYTRMRHEDPRGDYGRQLRQRQVVTAMLQKLASVNSILKYKSILNVLSANMKTNLSFEDMQKIFINYRGGKNITQLQLQGQTQEIDGVDYEVVPESNLTKIQQALKKTLK